jgi:hypothetical protein
MATEAAYQEWQSSNKDRAHPFSESVTTISVSGIELPNDVFTDGFFYPINLVGNLYIAEINYTANTITIADTEDGSIKGTSSNTFGTGKHEFYDDLGRYVGCLIEGPGAANLGADLLFDASRGLLASAVVYAQNQQGVRGLKLTDGTILTGEVTLIGTDGIVLSTNNDGTIRVDIVGTPGDPDLLEPTVRNIIVYGNCVLNAVQDVNVAEITSIYDRPSDICTAKANIINPDGTFPIEDVDACATTPPPPVWEPCPPELDPGSPEPPCDHGGYFFFNALSPIVDIKALEYSGPIVSIVGISSSNDFENLAGQLPPRSTGALRFSMKG